MDLNILKEKIPVFLKSLSSSAETLLYDEGIVQAIYDIKINKEKSPFSNKTLKNLDFYRYFDDYLFPNLNSARDPDFSKAYYFSLISLINHKFGEHILFWDYINISEEELSLKFKLIMKFIVNIEYQALNYREKTQILIFLNQHFKYIEKNYFSEELMKLVSPYLFLRTHKIYLKKLFLQYPKLITLYQAISKSSEDQEISLKQINFLPNVLQDFLSEIVEIKQDKWNKAFELFVYKVMQLFIDLLSQITTRRFLKYLIESEQVIALIRTIKLERFNYSFLCLLEDLEYYLKYPINEETGEVQTTKTQILLRSDFLKQLQFLLFKMYQLSPNISEIENLDFLKLLDIDKDLPKILKSLNVRVPIYNLENPIDFLVNILSYSFPPKPKNISRDLPLIPSDELIWDYKKIPDENINEILSLPKMNLQFLDVQDYLLRNFILFRLESAYEIRYDIEDSVKKMGPRFNADGILQGFHDWSRMATKLNKLVINEISNPLLGHKEPARVFAEITYSTKEMPNYVKKEWESLREHEILFLVSFSRKNLSNTQENQKFDDLKMENEEQIIRFKERYGIKSVRGCEIIAQFDEKHKQISYETGDKKKINLEGYERTLHVLFDPFQYQMDLEKSQQTEIYSEFQLIIRRKPKENNFKSILGTISNLMNEKLEIPSFLSELILGYGESEKSTSQFYAKNNLIKFNFLDTFLDEAHFQENLIMNKYLPNEIKSLKYEELSKSNIATKKNLIRFNDRQIESIFYALQYGVTLIVGPPGTGKTDIAVQVANLLYNNFRNERTLIITHSNYALNDIFEKIVKLEIDERHLIRLGLGEKDLDTGKNFSKQGRINYLLERRLTLLSEVKLMANSMKNEDSNEFTCETAQIFFSTLILTKWNEFLNKIKSKSDLKFYLENYPFHDYLKDSTLFFFSTGVEDKTNESIPNGNMSFINFGVKTPEDLLNLFYLIWNKMENIFLELKDLRLLEILRSPKERGNFLIAQQAKIIAMTSTHAAMKRSHFVEIGFEYDNVIFEESAQIMEIESFIPLFLSNSKIIGKKPRLKRVIMLGDDNQLPPIIKNTNYQKLSNLEQSLYTRLLRLSTPCIKLTQQGRCRDSILDLYRWKYENLESMPCVFSGEYEKRNCGFVHEYQFIDVNENNGNGETCPNPHFYQNLAEAEYVVATYMYMVLKGYDPNKITILTTYNGQKYLIRDIIHHKCSWSQIFRKPKKITTVDKFQGQQNDYILLSLVRTKSIGHIRDPRRLIVAMSRAKFGLYVFGKFELFKGFHEISQIFKLFEKKTLKLELLINEISQEKEILSEEKTKAITIAENFQDMYKIVENLLKTKIN